MADAAPSVFAAAAALGRQVQRAWNAAERDEQAFPDIAFDALGAGDPPAFSLDQVAPFLLTTRIAQSVSGRVFSDMPLVVYRGDGFYIEVLIWVDGTTLIHHHAFSGAFRLLHGSSLHSVYRFEETRRISSRARVGKVTCTGMRYLQRGDRHRISSGPNGLAHALFHLERPSVTLVVRTDTDPDAGPQHSLYPPALALAPLLQDRLEAPLQRWLAVLAGLQGQARLDHLLVDQLFEFDFGRFARFALEFPDFGALLDRRTPWQQALGEPSAARRRLEGRFGAELAEVLMQAIFEAQRCDSLRRIRRSVTDPELRFFLALLLNARSRAHVFAAVRDRRAGDDPAAVCSTALLRLADLPADPAHADLAARAPWVCTLHEVLSSAGDAAGAVAQRLVAGSLPERLRADGARAVEDAAGKLAALPALRALAAD